MYFQSNPIHIEYCHNNRRNHKYLQMGHIQSISSEQYDDNHTVGQLEIPIDFNKPISDHFKQLLNWSLQEIREIYAPFRKRKSSPILSRSEFLRFIRLSRISSFDIYDKIVKQDKINAFEVMSILILTAYTTYTYKTQFIFNVFDLQGTKTLKFNELILMFKSVVRGFAILTNQPLPQINLLEKYAQTVFTRADLNNDQNLQLGEIIAWASENKSATQLFKKFQPKQNGREDYHIFNGFCPYHEDQVRQLMERVSKVHRKEKLAEEDYKLLRVPQKLPKSIRDYKENGQSGLFLTQNSKNTFKNTKMFDRTAENIMDSKKFSQSATFNFTLSKKQGKMPFFDQSNFNNSTLSMMEQSQVFTRSGDYLKSQSPSKMKKKKFNNIIIIKGRTITKKEIFDLRDYFDKLSNGKEAILIEDFIESFSQQRYNHMKSVAASLYNFLDHNQNGKVTFKELITKLYPNLSSKHIKIIDDWSDEYNTNFNLKSKVQTRQQQQIKKRVLPKTCLPRFKEMFDFFDSTKKGYVTYDDLRKVLSQACTQKQMMQLFEDSDLDHDGKLTLGQFANVLLPSDLQIQGLQ